MAVSNNLTKRDIALELCKKIEQYNKKNIQQNEARMYVQTVLDLIANALIQGRNVELRNFGVFEVQLRQPRIGRNPNKPKDDVVIPKRLVVKFKAGKELKAALKQKDLSSIAKAKKKSD